MSLPSGYEIIGERPSFQIKIDGETQPATYPTKVEAEAEIMRLDQYARVKERHEEATARRRSKGE